MDYNGIINRIANNLGKADKSSVFISIVKLDIIDAVSKIFRKTEPIKSNRTETITADSQELTMADDFFVPLEVIFISSSGQRFPNREIDYEEYMKWNPDVETNTTSFTSLVTSATPQEMIYTQENEDFDGLVGYTFTDEVPQRLLWKPAIAGSVSIYYSKAPEVDFLMLSDEPEVNRLFHNLIVDEVTIKHLVRKLNETTSEVLIYQIDRQLKYYQKERDEALNDLSGFVNRNTDTPRIVPFNFLNDYWMMIRNYNE